METYKGRSQKGKKKANHLQQKGGSLESGQLERWLGSSSLFVGHCLFHTRQCKDYWWDRALVESMDVTWLQESYVWLWNQSCKWILSIFWKLNIIIVCLWTACGHTHETVSIKGSRLTHWLLLRLGYWAKQLMLTILCPPLRRQLRTGVSYSHHAEQRADGKYWVQGCTLSLSPFWGQVPHSLPFRFHCSDLQSLMDDRSISSYVVQLSSLRLWEKNSLLWSNEMLYLFHCRSGCDSVMRTTFSYCRVRHS